MPNTKTPTEEKKSRATIEAMTQILSRNDEDALRRARTRAKSKGEVIKCAPQGYERHVYRLSDKFLKTAAWQAVRLALVRLLMNCPQPDADDRARAKKLLTLVEDYFDTKA